jgi:hypothetical protein
MRVETFGNCSESNNYTDMRRFLIFAALVLLALPSVAASTQEQLLPKTFAGWQVGKAQASTDPAVADPTHPALLKEYGFVDFQSGTYTRENRAITVKAIRFKDASGAYGAFVFYKEPAMLTEEIGEQGAGANERVIFYRGNVLVQAVLDKVTAMSGGELRELASLLPQVNGPGKNPPTLPAYLPKQSYIKNSARYVIGPQGLTAIGSPFSAEVIDFSKGTEVALGKYNTAEGTATLMLISYPTPAIAGERLRALNAAPTISSSPDVAGPMHTKRAGPIDVVVAGQISEDEARSLLASVNYDADVTWNERAPTAKDNLADFIINEAKLVGFVLGAAILFGVMFASARILTKRYWPGHVFDRPDDVEIIELKLRDYSPARSPKEANEIVD